LCCSRLHAQFSCGHHLCAFSSACMHACAPCGQLTWLHACMHACAPSCEQRLLGCMHTSLHARPSVNTERLFSCMHAHVCPFDGSIEVFDFNNLIRQDDNALSVSRSRCVCPPTLQRSLLKHSCSVTRCGWWSLTWYSKGMINTVGSQESMKSSLHSHPLHLPIRVPFSFSLFLLDPGR
jgi:hypothetical protein